MAALPREARLAQFLAEFHCSSAAAAAAVGRSASGSALISRRSGLQLEDLGA